MTGNQKTYLFAAILVGSALMLWGTKGIMQLLPGPNPR